MWVLLITIVTQPQCEATKREQTFFEISYENKIVCQSVLTQEIRRLRQIGHQISQNVSDFYDIRVFSEKTVTSDDLVGHHTGREPPHCSHWEQDCRGERTHSDEKQSRCWPVNLGFSMKGHEAQVTERNSLSCNQSPWTWIKQIKQSLQNWSPFISVVHVLCLGVCGGEWREELIIDSMRWELLHTAWWKCLSSACVRRRNKHTNSNCT